MSDSDAESMDESDAQQPTEYVLPVVPVSVEVDPLVVALLHCVAFMDLCDDDVMDPDAAGDALEHVGMYVQRLPAERLAALAADLERLAQHGAEAGWSADQCETVKDFLYSCGVGEERQDD